MMSFHNYLVLLEESKLTIAQRQKSAFKLRENDEKKSDSELLVQMPLVRPRTSRRRSLSTIRESGIYEMDRLVLIILCFQIKFQIFFHTLMISHFSKISPNKTWGR